MALIDVLPIIRPTIPEAYLRPEKPPMNGTMGPATAAAAIALRQANPAASALVALDAATAKRDGALGSFGDTIQPETPSAR